MINLLIGTIVLVLVWYWGYFWGYSDGWNQFTHNKGSNTPKERDDMKDNYHEF